MRPLKSLRPRSATHCKSDTIVPRVIGKTDSGIFYEKMRYYFAPLEGITGYCFRQAHHQYFPGLDAYFTPFVVATYTKKLKSREKRDVLPENNAGVPTIPQILTNHAEEFDFMYHKFFGDWFVHDVVTPFLYKVNIISRNCLYFLKNIYSIRNSSILEINLQDE